MALKGDRYEAMTDITFRMNEVAERGGVAVLSTAGSGAALDQSVALVTYAAAASGTKPIGLLLGDMVNKDLTQTHLNFHKNEVQKGGKVTLLTDGWVVTDRIYPGATPAGGDVAYLAGSGYITSVVDPVGGTAASPKVGRFYSSKDEDGYAKVYIKLPQV